MTQRPKMGRDSIFRGKAGGVRVQGILTKKGGQQFEASRRALASLVKGATGHRPSVVSDADVIEFLARGEADTRKYLTERMA